MALPRPERPLEFDGSALVEFAARLRRLREQAGRPPYRQLAGRVHYSSTTLADAASGRRVPTLAVVLAYVRACGGDETEWEHRWRALVAEPAAESGAGRDDRAPYRGLAAYQVGDEEWFFGRERLVDELVARTAGTRLVTVFGPSGAGKSSLLRAGLVPRLGARVAVFTPGPYPLEECAIHLARLLGGTASAALAELTADARGLHRLVRQALADEPPDAEIVLVIDQFEEVFTLCQDPGSRSRLIAALVQASAAANSRCRVVLGVRADFYAHCLSDAALTETLRDGQFAVGPMSVDELRRAIVRPARHAGCIVENSLLATLIAQAHGRTGSLPLLSHALLETWRHRRGSTLTLDGFHRAGGIDGALVRSAEAVFTSLTDHERRVTKDLLLRLVALGEGTEDTKRRVTREELDGDPAVGTVVGKLTDARLVVVSDQHVELTHEVLIRAWPRLRGWLTEDRHALRVHRELTEATALWQEHDGDAGTLLRGTRLAMVEQWARENPRTNHAERAFLDASIAARRAEHRTARRRAYLTRTLTALLAVLLVSTTTVAVHAMRTEEVAARQRNTAGALEAARDAAALVDTNPTLAARLGLAAYRLYPSPATRDTLVVAAAAATTTPLGTTGTLRSVSLAAHGGIKAAALRHSDLTVLSLVADRAARAVATLPGGYHAVRFSPDGRLIATVARDAVARVWDISDPVRPRQLATIPGKAIDLWFSPDSSLLLTADFRGDRRSTRHRAVGRVWEFDELGRLQQLATLARPKLAEFGPDRSVAVAEDDSTATSETFTVWNLATPQSPRREGQVTRTPAEGIISAAFVEQDTLVTGDIAGVLAVWRRQPTPDPPIPLSSTRSNGDAILEIAPSPRNKRVATTDRDGVVALWDISGAPRKLIELANDNDSRFTNLTFGADGRTLSALRTSQYGNISLVRWHLDAGRSAALVCARISPLSEEGWDDYFPEIPDRPMC